MITYQVSRGDGLGDNLPGLPWCLWVITYQVYRGGGLDNKVPGFPRWLFEW